MRRKGEMGNMKPFDPERFVGATIPLGVSWQPGMVMESKGRQDLYESGIISESRP